MIQISENKIMPMTQYLLKEEVEAPKPNEQHSQAPQTPQVPQAPDPVVNEQFLKDIDKFGKFLFNFPHNFMDAFPESHIKTHLQEKITGYIKKEGPTLGMLTFWMLLDEGNKKYLASWIDKNYKG